jgi:hypothetical protein
MTAAFHENIASLAAWSVSSMVLGFAFHIFCCCLRKCSDRSICLAEDSHGFYL